MINIVSLRRDFHQYPEVAFTEFRTASKVVEVLTSLGYTVLYGKDAIDEKARRSVPTEQTLQLANELALRNGANPKIIEEMKGGLTAVVGILHGNQPGPTIAFRFDMDALPIVESSDPEHLPQSFGFRSQYEGTMHACGHDTHIAIGLGLAEKMSKQQFAGTLKLIFQPAEEGGRGGAYAMVNKGIVDDVDQLYCFHIGSGQQNLALGEICAGSSDWLATTKLAAHFYGVASHAGTSPENGRNALLGAATALLNIHALPRFSSCVTRVNVGILEGGTAPNIIPEYAKMIIETRASSEEVNADLENRVKHIVKHSAEMHGLRHDVDIIGQATTINCDPEALSIVLEEAPKVAGINSVKDFGSFGGSEDASFLIRRVQERGGKGTYMLIGTPIPAGHHNPRFDISEEVLPISVELLERIAKRTLTAKG
ncbi:MAG: amidohydrolase [Desulfitobacteriaceae bacterium]